MKFYFNYDGCVVSGYGLSNSLEEFRKTIPRNFRIVYDENDDLDAYEVSEARYDEICKVYGKGLGEREEKTYLVDQEDLHWLLIHMYSERYAQIFKDGKAVGFLRGDPLSISNSRLFVPGYDFVEITKMEYFEISKGKDNFEPLDEIDEYEKIPFMVINDKVVDKKKWG